MGTGATNTDGEENGLILNFVVSDGIILQIICNFTAGQLKRRVCWYGTWNPWRQIADQSYVDDKILVIDKIITLPEGETTRGVVEVPVEYGNRRIMSYSVLAAESGASFHAQAAYTSGGKLTFVYDKQGTNSFNVTLRLVFM